MHTGSGISKQNIPPNNNTANFDNIKSTINNNKQLTGESRYEFHGLAGKGTFGVVYTGKDKQTG